MTSYAGSDLADRWRQSCVMQAGLPPVSPWLWQGVAGFSEVDVVLERAEEDAVGLLESVRARLGELGGGGTVGGVCP